jgi:hypothetical protein
VIVHVVIIVLRALARVIYGAERCQELVVKSGRVASQTCSKSDKAPVLCRKAVLDILLHMARMKVAVKKEE